MGGEAVALPLAIVGPTASGKSALALELARRQRDCDTATSSVELLSADSMQVYRRMDIGTAKPSVAEQAEILHHLIDLVEPSERFTVVDYASAFETAMADITARGATPMLVGGTGLYLRAVVDGLRPPPEFAEIAAELEAEATVFGPGDGATALHERLAELDPLAASRMEATNQRRIVRALSVCLGTGLPFSSFGPGLSTYAPAPYRFVGIEIDRDELDERIEQRYRRQLEAGFVDEVSGLAGADLSRTASQALGYKELLAHVRWECSLDEAIELAVARTRRFARRQQRWFSRDPRITWIPTGDVSEMADRIGQLQPW